MLIKQTVPFTEAGNMDRNICLFLQGSWYIQSFSQSNSCHSSCTVDSIYIRPFGYGGFNIGSGSVLSSLPLSLHWCPGEKMASQFLHVSSLVLGRIGEQLSDPVDDQPWLRSFSGPDLGVTGSTGALWIILMCSLSLFSETASKTHWSHFSITEAPEAAPSPAVDAEEVGCFL